jgi:hypothetical protein
MSFAICSVSLRQESACFILRAKKHLLMFSTMIISITIMFLLSRTSVYAGGYLQYNGVYACYDEGGDMPGIQYFRFYPDNTVIDVASTGSPAEIQHWFKKERANAAGFGRGRITQLKGNKISFYTN